MLADPAIRQELAEISRWPTIPQLFVDGALGSRTAWLHKPYADIADGCPAPTGNAYLDAEAVTAHLSACTEAGVDRKSVV